jgi:ubiquinone/menaquinone biosynthesis C-methylase UbiE
MPRKLASYDAVAGFYDILSQVWSLGRIRAAKLDQLSFLKAGQDVLYIGCGSGTDVLAAAAHGCNVTAVDTSRKMLERLRARLDREGLSARLIDRPIDEMPPGETFDAVCANFFLNLFPEPAMRQHLAAAAQRVRPNGMLMIADVAPPAGALPSRVANQVYLYGAMLPFWVAGLVHWHPNHNYLAALEALGWRPVHIRPFRMPPGGPVMYRNIVARRATTAGQAIS